MRAGLALRSHSGLQVGLALPGGLPPTVPVTERQCPFWSAGWGRCSPGKGLKEATAVWLQPRGWGGDQGRREASGRVPAPFAGRDSTPSRGYGDSKGCIEPISVLGGALPQGGVRWRSFGTPCLLSGPRPGPGRPLPDPGAPAQAGRAGGWRPRVLGVCGVRGGAGGAYPWWAAGSQAPGSRALRTALFRSALSW